MRLQDEVYRQSDSTPHPAYVYMQGASASSVFEDGPGARISFDVEEQPRAIVGPKSTGWQAGQMATWRGTQYEVSGVLPRMKRGRVHHYTLALQLPDVEQ